MKFKILTLGAGLALAAGAAAFAADAPPAVDQRNEERIVIICEAGPGGPLPVGHHGPGGPGPPGVMHAKLVVVDQSSALVTSANFTAAAQNHNIEAGLLLRHPHQVKRILSYFEGLMKLGKLKKLPA